MKKYKSKKFQMLNTDTDTHIEIPIYYWQDENSTIYIDKELMIEDFNEKLHELSKKHSDGYESS
tara:strand:+ start:3527 stop:3718 length:192 start_codon:yes stop_codon:yes gene_type:complete